MLAIVEFETEELTVNSDNEVLATEKKPTHVILFDDEIIDESVIVEILNNHDLANEHKGKYVVLPKEKWDFINTTLKTHYTITPKAKE